MGYTLSGFRAESTSGAVEFGSLTADNIDIITTSGGITLSSLIPFIAVLVSLLANPRNAASLTKSAVNAYSVRPDTVSTLLRG